MPCARPRNWRGAQSAAIGELRARFAESHPRLRRVPLRLSSRQSSKDAETIGESLALELDHVHLVRARRDVAAYPTVVREAVSDGGEQHALDACRGVEVPDGAQEVAIPSDRAHERRRGARQQSARVVEDERHFDLVVQRTRRRRRPYDLRDGDTILNDHDVDEQIGCVKIGIKGRLVV